MNFATLPDRRAALDPHGPAVADRSGSLTNADLLDAVLSVTRRLHGLGISPGDVVAVKLSNRIEFVLLLFAVTVVKLQEGADLRGFDHTFETLPADEG